MDVFPSFAFIESIGEFARMKKKDGQSLEKYRFKVQVIGNKVTDKPENGHSLVLVFLAAK